MALPISAQPKPIGDGGFACPGRVTLAARARPARTAAKQGSVGLTNESLGCGVGLAYGRAVAHIRGSYVPIVVIVAIRAEPQNALHS